MNGNFKHLVLATNRQFGLLIFDILKNINDSHFT